MRFKQTEWEYLEGRFRVRIPTSGVRISLHVPTPRNCVRRDRETEDPAKGRASPDSLSGFRDDIYMAGRECKPRTAKVFAGLMEISLLTVPANQKNVCFFSALKCELELSLTYSTLELVNYVTIPLYNLIFLILF